MAVRTAKTRSSPNGQVILRPTRAQAYVGGLWKTLPMAVSFAIMAVAWRVSWLTVAAAYIVFGTALALWVTRWRRVTSPVRLHDDGIQQGGRFVHWSEIGAISVIPGSLKTSVQLVIERPVARWLTLAAPVQGWWFRDPDFDHEVSIIRSYWLEHRGESWTPPPPPWRPPPPRPEPPPL